VGEPDRKPTETRIEAASDIDASRLLSLLSALSESSKRMAIDGDANPVPPVSREPADVSLRDRSSPKSRSGSPRPPNQPAPSARDLPSQDVTSHLPPAPNIAPPRPRPLRSAPVLQDEFRASTSVELQPRRSHWLAWTLASSFVAAAIATAFGPGLVDRRVSHTARRGPQHVTAALTSVGSRQEGTPPSSAAAVVPRHGRVVVKDQKSLINQLVPLGISVTGDSKGEIVVLEGLAEGTQLSAGTNLTSNRWSLPAEDLDKAFVSPPHNFSGTMEVTAKLYSPSTEPLQTEVVRWEWVGEGDTIRSENPVPSRASVDLDSAVKSAPLPHASEAWPPQVTSASAPIVRAEPSPPKAGQADAPARQLSEAHPSQPETPRASDQARPAEDLDALLLVGERLLREGDIAAARLALRRAAEAGSAAAARDLGMSYDPSFLRGIRAAATPDPAQAEEWYATAKRLDLRDSSQEADRLARIPKPGAR